MSEPNYIYHIAERMGKLFVNPPGSKPLLNADELDSLADKLHAMAELSRTTGLTSVDLYLYARCEQLAPQLTDLVWVFPAVRSDTFKSGPCVYFLTSAKRPDQVKIGCAKNVAQRCASIKRHIGGAAQIVAFARTEWRYQAETYFHRAFHRHVVENEWYQAEPVFVYLEQVKSYVRSHLPRMDTL